MKESEIGFLMQLADSLDEALSSMKKYYDLKDIQKFNSVKKAFLDINNKIKEGIQ